MPHESGRERDESRTDGRLILALVRALADAEARLVEAQDSLRKLTENRLRRERHARREAA